MKKTFIFLVLALLLSCKNDGPAIVGEVVDSGTCGENLTWTLTDKGVLTIFGVGKMNRWETMMNEPSQVPWIKHRYNIKSVIVENGVLNIGDNAFWGCENLTSISIPSSVTKIGEYVFYQCQNLYSIIIPEGVTSIEDHTFVDCVSLTSITLPEGLKEIKNAAFSGCNHLTSITIPSNVASIGEYAFYECGSLTSIAIPNEVTTIRKYTFYKCRKLEHISLGAKVNEIKEQVLGGCYNVQTIECYNPVPPSVSGSYGSNSDISPFAIIYVPASSYGAYSSHDFWGKYDIRTM